MIAPIGMNLPDGCSPYDPVFDDTQMTAEELRDLQDEQDDLDGKR